MTARDAAPPADAPAAPTPARGRKPQAPTKAELEDRLLYAERVMLLEGNDRKAARRLARKFDVRYDTALTYCARVRRRWREDAEREGGDREALRREHRERFMKLVQKGLGDKGSLKVALIAAERVAHLDGFLTAQKIEHSGSIQFTASEVISDALARAAQVVLPAPPSEGDDDG
ncbi:MAG: hypothetical protein Q8Q14_00575 [Gemmatimonadales bacterium]|nr:hypothetical protein [Gemmatimonadales bacterium]